MAIIRLAAGLKSAVVTPVKTAIDAGGAEGKIEIYTGSIPATVETAATGTKLGTLTFSYPCGTVNTAGSVVSLDMAAITQDSAADATGTAAWARILTSANVPVLDIDITSTGGGGSLTLNTTNIVIGGPILITAFVVGVA